METFYDLTKEALNEKSMVSADYYLKFTERLSNIVNDLQKETEDITISVRGFKTQIDLTKENCNIPEKFAEIINDFTHSLPVKGLQALQREVELIQGVGKVMDSDEYKAFLDTASKFYNYSFNNKMLIYLHNPEATYVRTYKQWNDDFGRTINHGEKGITLLRPTLEYLNSEEKINRYAERHIVEDKRDDFISSAMQKLNEGHPYSQIIGYNTFKVFDVSQTEGEKIPTASTLVDMNIEGDIDHFDDIKDTIIDIMNSNGITTVDFKGKDEDDILKSGAYGYFSPSHNSIVISNDLSQVNTINTMVHELAHALMHGKEMKVNGIENSHLLSKSEKELQAESVSYMVCKSLGIETDAKSFGYISTWMSKDKADGIIEMRKNLNTISRCSNYIMNNGINKCIEKINAEKQAELENNLESEQEVVLD